MSERRRFLLLTALLVLTLGLAAGLSARRIEAGLLVRTQAALAAEQIAFYDIEVQGRDVVLGRGRSVPEAARIEAIATAVPGVRRVRGPGPAEHVDDGAPALTRATVAQLRLERRGTMVTASGRLPDPVPHLLREALGARFADAASIQETLQADDSMPDRSDWQRLAPLLAELLALLGDPARITVNGEHAVATGIVADAEARRHIADLAAAASELRWSLELFVGSSEERRP